MSGAGSAISRKDGLNIGYGILATAAAGICAHERFGPIAAFAAAAVALSLLAMLVGHATEQLGSKMNPGATGVLQSALGNLPELFICIFSLRAGLVDVVKGALVGSILANSLLVLGIAILIGGAKNGTLKFAKEAPRMTAVLMLLATSALVVPTFAHELHTAASQHEVSLGVICAVVLLIVFACSLPFFLKGDPNLVLASDEPHESWPLAFSLLVLALSGVAAAFVSEWFVDALIPATKLIGLSQTFSGLVVAAIAGNAIENVVGVQLAYRNKADFALSVILNSSLQIALALIPALVIISMIMGGAALTLALPPLLACGLVLSAVVTAFIVFDGEAIWLEGVALIGLYAIIVMAFWWG